MSACCDPRPGRPRLWSFRHGSGSGQGRPDPAHCAEASPGSLVRLPGHQPRQWSAADHPDGRRGWIHGGDAGPSRCHPWARASDDAGSAELPLFRYGDRSPVHLLWVGGKLDIPETPQPGHCSGDFKVTVAYQWHGVATHEENRPGRAPEPAALPAVEHLSL